VRLIADKMLSAIRRSHALVVVLDITGVAAIDNRPPTWSRSSTLHSSRVHNTGISEQTTQALQWLQLGFRHRTASDLQAGIEQADLLLTSNGVLPPGAG
jgi:hypothetical protein